MLQEATGTLEGRTSTWQGTLPFFVIAFGFTWLLQLPAVLAKVGLLSGSPQRFLPLVGLAAFGPLVAAVVASRVEAGGVGVRGLLGSHEQPAPIAWYVLTPGVFGAIYLAGAGVYRLCGGAIAMPWLYLPENGDQLIALGLFPLVEEPGWRGFAFPRLQRRYGALTGSLLLGALWALWHTMMFVLQGASPGEFALMAANIVAASVVFGWVYNRTGGSLLVAVLLHAGAHLNNPTHAFPRTPVAFVVYTLAIVVVGSALVLGDRAAWRSRTGAMRVRSDCRGPATQMSI